MNQKTNPQLEDGYLKIANELVEQFTRIQLSPNEWRICWVVLRKTYGFNKKEDAISLTQFQKISNLSRPSVVKSIKKLVAKRILVAKQQPYIHIYSLNKHCLEWNSSYKDTSSYFATRVVAKQQPKLVAKQQPTKDNKDINTKDNSVRIKNKYPSISCIKEKDLIEISEKYQLPMAFVRSKLDDMINWAESKPNNPKLRGRNWRFTLIKFVKDDAVKIKEKGGQNDRKRGIDAEEILREMDSKGGE